MRKTIAILLLIIIGGIFYLYMDSMGDKTDEIINKNDLTTDTLVELARNDYDTLCEIISELQESPDQVVKFYALVTKALYSRDLNEDELKKIIQSQRRIFHQELLKENPEEQHISRSAALIQQAKQEDIKFVDYSINATEFKGESNDKARIKAVFYRNKPVDGGKIYQEFLLHQESSLWYIIGWKQIEEFSVVGE